MRAMGLPRARPGGLARARSRVQACLPAAWGAGPSGACPLRRRAPPQQQQQRQRRPGAGGGRRPAPPPQAARLTAQDIRRRRDNEPHIRELNDAFGIDGFVEFYAVDGGTTAAYLFHPSGQTLEINLQGATVTRWLDVAGRNLLFTRPDETYEPGVPITGSGIPLAFPQWRDGALPANGFAQRAQWEVVEAELDFDAENLDLALELARGARVAIDETGTSLIGGPFSGAEADAWEEEEGEGGGEEEGEEEGEEGEEEEEAKGRGRRARKKQQQGEEGEGGGAAAAAEVEAEAGPEPAAAASEGPPAAGGEEAPAKKKRGRPRKTDQQGGGGGGGGGGFVAAAVVEEEEEGGLGGSGGGGGGEGPGLPEWMSDVTMDDVDWALIGDIAPYVKLRLRDSEETRAMWPHPFELTVKISLSHTDDFPDPLEGLPRGPQPYDWDERTMFGQGPGGEPLPDSSTQRWETDLIATGESSAPPMQIKYEFELRHTGGQDAAPFSFQLAALTHFATRDQDSPNHGPFVRVLGLGGRQTFDYSLDPRFPRLDAIRDDYINFGHERIETVAIHAAKANVMFCPGDRTHFELLQREGLPDAVVYHPGPSEGSDLWRKYAVVGAGRVALPKTLKAGEEWRGEYVVRRHERYWDPPIWERADPQPQPPPLWVPPLIADEGAEEDLVVEAGEDTTGAEWQVSS